jgi:hypothetical protein
MTAADIRKRQRQHQRDSFRAAMKLDRIGMPVEVIEDNGQVMTTTLTQIPWSLPSGGVWVACVAGKSGGFDCTRISPIEPVERRVA